MSRERFITFFASVLKVEVFMRHGDCVACVLESDYVS